MNNKSNPLTGLTPTELQLLIDTLNKVEVNRRMDVSDTDNLFLIYNKIHIQKEYGKFCSTCRQKVYKRLSALLKQFYSNEKKTSRTY